MSYSLKDSLKYSLASVGVFVVTLSTSLPALAQTIPSRTTSSEGAATYTLSNGQQVPATSRDGTGATADDKGGVGYSDGTYVSVNGAGNTVVTSPNGNTTETNKDGHRLNGTVVLARESESSDGEATYTLSNGQQVPHTSPSGTEGTRDNKGGVSYDDGTYVSVDGDGNTIVTRNGTLQSVTNSDGETVFNAANGIDNRPGTTGGIKPMGKELFFGNKDTFGGMKDNLKGGPMGGMKDPMMGGGGKPGGMIYKPGGGGKPGDGLGGGKPGSYGSGPGSKPGDNPGGKPSTGSGGKDKPGGKPASGSGGKKQPSGGTSSSSSGGKKTTGSSSSSGSKDTKTNSDTGTKDTGTKDTGTKDTGTKDTGAEGKGGDKSFGAGTASGYGSQPAGKTAVDSKLAGMRGESNEPEDTAPGGSGRRDSSGGKTTQPGPGGQEGGGESSGAPRPSAPEGSGPSSTGLWTAPSGTTGPGMVINPTGIDKEGMPDGQTFEDALKDIETVTNPGQ